MQPNPKLTRIKRADFTPTSETEEHINTREETLVMWDNYEGQAYIDRANAIIEAASTASKGVATYEQAVAFIRGSIDDSKPLLETLKRLIDKGWTTEAFRIYFPRMRTSWIGSKTEIAGTDEALALFRCLTFTQFGFNRLREVAPEAFKQKEVAAVFDAYLQVRTFLTQWEGERYKEDERYYGEVAKYLGYFGAACLTLAAVGFVALGGVALATAAPRVAAAVVTGGAALTSAGVSAAANIYGKTTGEIGKLAASIGSLGGAQQGWSAGLSGSGQVTQFINTDVPNVVEMAFKLDGYEGRFKSVSSRARGRAKAMRKVIMDAHSGHNTGVASFGDVELRLSPSAHDILLDAAVEAVLYDHLLMTDCRNWQPGSMETCMAADTFDLGLFRDPRVHRDWQQYLTKGLDILKTGIDVYSAVKTVTAKPVVATPPPPPPAPAQPAPSYPTVAVVPPSPAVQTSALPEWAQTGIDLLKSVGVIKTSQPAAAPPAPTSTRFGTPIGAFTLYNGRPVVVPVTDVPAMRAQATAIIAQFLNNNSLIVQPNEGYPFYTATPPFPLNTIVQFQDAAVGLGSTSNPATARYLSRDPLFEHTSASLEDAVCGSIFDRKGVAPPAGEFYRSGMLIGELCDLPGKVYGQIRIDHMPYRIQINRNMVDSRAKVSFVHETLHAITELLKLGLSHEQLHSLSVFITSEVLPGYLALERKLQA